MCFRDFWGIYIWQGLWQMVEGWAPQERKWTACEYPAVCRPRISMLVSCCFVANIAIGSCHVQCFDLTSRTGTLRLTFLAWIHTTGFLLTPPPSVSASGNPCMFMCSDCMRRSSQTLMKVSRTPNANTKMTMYIIVPILPFFFIPRVVYPWSSTGCGQKLDICFAIVSSYMSASDNCRKYCKRIWVTTLSWFMSLALRRVFFLTSLRTGKFLKFSTRIFARMNIEKLFAPLLSGVECHGARDIVSCFYSQEITISSIFHKKSTSETKTSCTTLSPLLCLITLVWKKILLDNGRSQRLMWVVETSCQFCFPDSFVHRKNKLINSKIKTANLC